MPPITFFERTIGTWAAGTKTITLPTPTRAREGDLLLAIIASPTLESITWPADWTIDAQLVNVSGPNFHVLRHLVVADEPASIPLVFAVAPSSPPLATCLLYRGLDTGAALVASNFTKYAGATTHLIAPAVVLQHYSDIVITMHYSVAVSATFTPINSLVERLDTAVGGGLAGSFAVADINLEATGSSGAREETCSASATGAAAQVAYAAGPIIGAAPILSDRHGAIGFPTVGV